MKLHESGEMYLETILVLSKKLPVVRAIDITETLELSKPSVSRALKTLESNGFIEIDKRKYITLNKKGLEVASMIYERHMVITTILTQIGVSKDVAEDDACKIEHVISKETFDAIKRHFNIK